MKTPLKASYLSFEPVDMTVLLWLAGGLILFFVLLLVMRTIGRMNERRAERRSAWATFAKVARARGLAVGQIRALSVAAEAGKLRRPSQIMSSVMVLDRCVEKAQEQGILSESQLIALGQVRQRIMSTTDVRSAHEERRHLERVPCNLQLEVSLIAREEVGYELPRSETSAPDSLRSKLDELAQAGTPTAARALNLGAGGIALEVAGILEDTADSYSYIGLRATQPHAPFDLSGIWGEVRAVSDGSGDHVVVFHLSFLPYEVELKRQIIQLVYQSTEEGSSSKTTVDRDSSSATAAHQAPPSRRADQPARSPETRSSDVTPAERQPAGQRNPAGKSKVAPPGKPTSVERADEAGHSR